MEMCYKRIPCPKLLTVLDKNKNDPGSPPPKPFPPSIISWPRFVPIAWQIKIFDDCQN